MLRFGSIASPSLKRAGAKRLKECVSYALSKATAYQRCGCAETRGVVAYVTCSPVLDEARHIVDAVLAERRTMQRLDVPRIMRDINPSIPVPEPRADGAAQDMQLFEHIHDTDQMFIAVLRKDATDTNA